MSVPAEVQKATAKLMDAMEILDGIGCGDKVEEAIDEIMLIFKGEKRRSTIRCPDGTVVRLVKVGKDLRIDVESPTSQQTEQAAQQ